MKGLLARYLALFVGALLVTGCAPKIRIMASESMFEENRMEKIALLGQGGIRWRSALLRPDIKLSRTGLESLMGAIEKELKAKGYEPVLSQPVRIIFGVDRELARARKTVAISGHMRLTHEFLGMNGRYFVYEDYYEDKENKREIRVGAPAYEYPFDGEEVPLGEAARDILRKSGCLEGTEAALESCQGLEAQMLAISNTTGADTVCIVDVAGREMTPDARAFMSFGKYVSAATGMAPPNAPQQSAISLKCIDSGTGEVLWWHLQDYQVSATNTFLKDRLAREFLRFVPDAGQPLKAKCSVYMSAGSCRPSSEEPGQDCAREFPSSPIWECNLQQFYSRKGSVKQ